MATDTHKLSEEKRDDKAAASAATESEAGCAESMAEHFAGPGGMKAMAEAMARCCGAFASGGAHSPAAAEGDEAGADTEAATPCGKEA